MTKFIDTKGLKFKMWTYFTLFSVFIFVMLWLFQIIFLNTYYQSMKISEIRKITKEVAAVHYSDNFEEIIYRTAFNNGVIIQVYNSEGMPLLGEENPAAHRFTRTSSESVRKLIYDLKQKETGEIISFIVDNDRPGTPMVVAGTRVLSDGEEFFLTLFAPLAPISATTAVLKNQLLLVTVILLVIAFALSYVIAKIISKPLLKITDTAGNLAKGDYTVVFQKGNYTEINRLADTLNFATEELSKTDALRRDLIANVSHDLRTPLTIIKSYAEMIRDFSGENTEKRNEHAKVIIDESDKMSTLVNDILDLSKAESGTMELSFTRFNLSEVITGILNRFSSLTERDGFEFIFNTEDSCFVNADEQKISQAIYNLVNNAVNYTGEDKKVVISLYRRKSNIRFAVSDTGKGIAPNDIPRVWERYYRANCENTRYGAGTGIGLSIVKNFLVAHNAEYGVDSSIGCGSTFWFELPEDKLK